MLQRALDLLHGTFGRSLGGKKVKDVSKALGAICKELVGKLELGEDENAAKDFSLAFQSVRAALPNALPLATIYSREDPFKENVFLKTGLQASASSFDKAIAEGADKWANVLPGGSRAQILVAEDGPFVFLRLEHDTGEVALQWNAPDNLGWKVGTNYLNKTLRA